MTMTNHFSIRKINDICLSSVIRPPKEIMRIYMSTLGMERKENNVSNSQHIANEGVE